MSAPVIHWNNRPVTNDTATADILARYAYLNDVVIHASRAYRLPGHRPHVWNIEFNNGDSVCLETSFTRARCLDGTFIEWLGL